MENSCSAGIAGIPSQATPGTDGSISLTIRTFPHRAFPCSKFLRRNSSLRTTARLCLPEFIGQVTLGTEAGPRLEIQSDKSIPFGIRTETSSLLVYVGACGFTVYSEG